MKLIALLQAREGSSRLPNKALLDLNGLALLEHVRRRLMAVGCLDGVVVSTSVESPNIIDFCQERKWKYWAGSEDDLLSRHLGAAMTYDADAILRVTGDCLFHDPSMLDKMCGAFTQARTADALINWHHGNRTVSEGLDAEIVTVDCMRRLMQDKNCPREDWLTFLDRSPNYNVMGWAYPNRVGHDLHLSIDTPEDLEMARKMLEIIGNDEHRYQVTMSAYRRVRDAS